MATLSWTAVDSDGSLFSRGKHDYYAILVRGVPEERPKDCIIELYVSAKEMTLSEIKYNVKHERIRLLSRLIVMGNLSPAIDVLNAIEEMRDTAERREKVNPNTSISSAFTFK